MFFYYRRGGCWVTLETLIRLPHDLQLRREFLVRIKPDDFKEGLGEEFEVQNPNLRFFDEKSMFQVKNTLMFDGFLSSYLCPWLATLTILGETRPNRKISNEFNIIILALLTPYILLFLCFRVPRFSVTS